MYIPKRYDEKDQEKIYSFLRENSFAILVSVNEGVPVATHIPLLLELDDPENLHLSGHISKGNAQKETLKEGSRVLCIFPGPHAYISPRWYSALDVPTWNYISVHVYGTIRLVGGDQLKTAVSKMVDYYEKFQLHPMKVDELPEKMLHADLRGIIGFEIRIDDLQAVAKLSQNRDEHSYHNVISELEQNGDPSANQVAEAMRENSEKLFPR